MISTAQTIEEILTEASAYGRRDEVKKEALRLMVYFTDLDEDEAYVKAFNRLIDLDEKNK